jgi:hypothetical protein
MDEHALIPVERIRTKILLIRGQRVMLDRDLAELYGVETGQLTRQVRRNVGRFPADFAFRLTAKEFDSQPGFSKPVGRGGRRYRPWVFTEQGVAMLSSVLRSPQAIQVNVQIMRAFVQLRQVLSTQDGCRAKVAALERRLTLHDAHFRTVFDAIRQLMASPAREPRKRIGFRRNGRDG